VVSVWAVPETMGVVAIGPKICRGGFEVVEPRVLLK
jgi:hypothetical protein